ncbi:S10 family peptidase [Sphingomonas sp.]|uniref:S10 family peptidase n=1 Tax=Sphingomonas sp. TaxID=28214 RepID=UPI002DBB9733|nr:peptidase S10 [Sphingomonas sp.]HEU4967533.1 peptidase S10 [Sphingomonas sp.]
MTKAFLLAAAALLSAPALAQDKPKDDAKAEKAVGEIPPPQVVVTHHSGTFGGQKINYTATAGEIYLKAEDGTPRAAINYYSYVKEPRDPSRPVTFLFNGGPGSGSVWLHMGAFGPKRVAIPSNGTDDGAPPYPLVDNPDSLLDVTDIVFIDPVGTGFSHALGKTDPKEFWGVTKDAKSINQVIRLWLNDNGRWNSPKFLGGESYGTTRSAAVAHQLEGSYNDVSLNGIILISTILDFGAQAEVEGNDMAYVIALPSMAAVAWYHDKVPNKPATVAEFVAEAKAFASGEYITALMKGQALTGPERDAIRAKVARYTGLSEQYVERTDLRVSPGRFWKELLRDRGLVVGRLDSRYTGKDRDNAGEGFDNDPSFYGIDGGYTAAINAYVRSDLGFKSDRSYVTIGSVQPWDWDLGDRGDGTYYKSVAPYLGQALRENSGLRIFVGQGYYDFATPFYGAEYALTRTGFPQDRIQFHYYDAGHMMYVRDEDRHKLANDIRTFIRSR